MTKNIEKQEQHLPPPRTIDMVEFKITRSGKKHERAQCICKSVIFPQQINSFLNASKNNFTNQNAITILNKIYEVAPWDDVEFSTNDMKQLLQLCDEILKSLETVSGYSIFDVGKPFGVNKGMLQKFAFELSGLLQSALESDKPVSVRSLGD